MAARAPARRPHRPGARHRLDLAATLPFSIERYEAVIVAYLRYVVARAAAGEPRTGLASVVLFFLSRIDSKVDARLAGTRRCARSPRTARSPARSDVDAAEADETLRGAAAAGVDVTAVTADLEREGARSFCDACHRLPDAIEGNLVSWAAVGD